MIDEIAKITGAELHAATDRGLAMLALRPLSAALGRQMGQPMMMASGKHAALDLGRAGEGLEEWW